MLWVTSRLHIEHACTKYSMRRNLSNVGGDVTPQQQACTLKMFDSAEFAKCWGWRHNSQQRRGATRHLAQLELSKAHLCKATTVALDTYHVLFYVCQLRIFCLFYIPQLCIRSFYIWAILHSILLKAFYIAFFYLTHTLSKYVSKMANFAGKVNKALLLLRGGVQKRGCLTATQPITCIPTAYIGPWGAGLRGGLPRPLP